ncbi:hypothetical protein [Bifidobacterium choloepi]|nr:hypothetical protein [Bifidobacterium choloepi]
MSAVKNELIASGLVYESEYGVVSFTVPGMTNYIQRRQPVDLAPYEQE